MGSLQPHHQGEGNEASSILGTCAERAVNRHVASATWTAPGGVLALHAMVALTAVRGVSAQYAVENSRDLCLQAIQTAIVDRTSDLFQDTPLRGGKQRPYVLYMLAEHDNFGDTFIDKGEELFLARLGIEPAAECSLLMGQSLVQGCHNGLIQGLLDGNATVLFHGGGNWGDLWPNEHKKRMRDLADYAIRPDMNLVTMPNSLKYYDQDTRETDEKYVASVADSKHPTTRMTFLFRQRDSYDTAKLMYPGVDVRLVPDMAFMIGPLLRVGSEKFKYDIILFQARIDKEGTKNQVQLRQDISDAMVRLAPHLTFYVGDWRDNPTNSTLMRGHSVKNTNVPSLRHGVVLDAAMKYFSTAKVVICDRLHASILSLLMDIPHVLVDGGVNTSSYGKRMMTRAAAFETSDHCTQTSLRYREAATLTEGISDALELLEEYF